MGTARSAAGPATFGYQPKASGKDMRSRRPDLKADSDAPAEGGLWWAYVCLAWMLALRSPRLDRSRPYYVRPICLPMLAVCSGRPYVRLYVGPTLAPIDLQNQTTGSAPITTLLAGPLITMVKARVVSKKDHEQAKNRKFFRA